MRQRRKRAIRGEIYGPRKARGMEKGGRARIHTRIRIRRTRATYRVASRGI